MQTICHYRLDIKHRQRYALEIEVFLVIGFNYIDYNHCRIAYLDKNMQRGINKSGFTRMTFDFGEMKIKTIAMKTYTWSLVGKIKTFINDSSMRQIKAIILKGIMNNTYMMRVRRFSLMENEIGNFTLIGNMINSSDNNYFCLGRK